MRSRKKLFLIATIPLVCLGALAGKTLAEAGVFRTVEDRGPAVAATVSGFDGGTEDAAFRAESAELYVSSGDFRDPSNGGRIYLVDTANPQAAPRDVTPELEFPFLPHGLDLWRAPEGNERLFVVNHRAGSGFGDGTQAQTQSHTVEIFDVGADGTLVHLRSVEDPAFIAPNDVAAAGAEQFYVTNDHGSGPGLARHLEDWLGLPFGNVVYFDGEEVAEVLDGLTYPNGVAISDDGTEVYVAETTGGRLHVLQRDPTSGSLRASWTSEHLTGLDNIDVAPDGSLWIGAHPKLLEFLGHAEDPTKHSPSQVLHATRAGDGWSVEEHWLDDGDRLSGSSVAASNGERVVVGAVFLPRLLILE